MTVVEESKLRNEIATYCDILQGNVWRPNEQGFACPVVYWMPIRRIEVNHIQMYFSAVDYEEHANNNTLKTIHAMKYLIANSKDSLMNLPKFIMKTDDDIYLNVPNLMDKLGNTSNQRCFQSL